MAELAFFIVSSTGNFGARRLEQREVESFPGPDNVIACVEACLSKSRETRNIENLDLLRLQTSSRSSPATIVQQKQTVK